LATNESNQHRFSGKNLEIKDLFGILKSVLEQSIFIHINRERKQ